VHTVSPVEVVDALADRIKRLNPKLNAYVTVDLENAREEAEMKHKIVGRRGADCLVLRVAAAIEALAPWSDRRPKEE
jgi:Asp-tRNA(Asn)/Glu-tRNA(Gln) amidotransferase A subunit family amidase